MSQGWKQARRLALVALAGVALLQSGCLWLAVGAGTAAGCAAGYAYLKGEVPQTYVASFDHTWAAAQTSLQELGMPVVSAEKKSATSGAIRSRLGNGDVVIIQVDEEASTFPADGSVTRVGVRVATFGDYPVSDRILAQLGAHLVPPGVVSKAAGSSGVVPAGGVVPAAANPIAPASWTGVPSVTPPPPPRQATAAPAPLPAAVPATTPPVPAALAPAPGLPASTPPPPLASPEPGR